MNRIAPHKQPPEILSGRVVSVMAENSCTNMREFGLSFGSNETKRGSAQETLLSLES